MTTLCRHRQLFPRRACFLLSLLQLKFWALAADLIVWAATSHHRASEPTLEGASDDASHFGPAHRACFLPHVSGSEKAALVHCAIISLVPACYAASRIPSGDRYEHLFYRSTTRFRCRHISQHGYYSLHSRRLHHSS